MWQNLTRKMNPNELLDQYYNHFRGEWGAYRRARLNDSQFIENTIYPTEAEALAQDAAACFRFIRFAIRQSSSVK